MKEDWQDGKVNGEETIDLNRFFSPLTLESMIQF